MTNEDLLDKLERNVYKPNEPVPEHDPGITKLWTEAYKSQIKPAPDSTAELSVAVEDFKKRFLKGEPSVLLDNSGNVLLANNDVYDSTGNLVYDDGKFRAGKVRSRNSNKPIKHIKGV